MLLYCLGIAGAPLLIHPAPVSDSWLALFCVLSVSVLPGITVASERVAPPDACHTLDVHGPVFRHLKSRTKDDSFLGR